MFSWNDVKCWTCGLVLEPFLVLSLRFQLIHHIYIFKHTLKTIGLRSCFSTLRQGFAIKSYFHVLCRVLIVQMTCLSQNGHILKNNEIKNRMDYDVFFAKKKISQLFLANFWQIAKMALFNPCMKFEFFGGQMTSFEVVKKSSLWTLFIISLWLRLCAYPIE